MSEITLVLTRTPLHEFIFVSGARRDTNEAADDIDETIRAGYYHSQRWKQGAPPDRKAYSGRWSSLLMVKGPKVQSVTRANPAAAAPAGNRAAPQQNAGQATETVSIAGSDFELLTDGKAIVEKTEYTAMERYRTDFGSLEGRYIMLHPRPDPYPLSIELGNSVVQTLRPGHSGNCIRVSGGDPGPEQGILIHEAPNVTYLIGCISPRPKGNLGAFENADRNPSYNSMATIMKAISGSAGGNASLFVLA